MAQTGQEVPSGPPAPAASCPPQPPPRPGGADPSRPEAPAQPMASRLLLGTWSRLEE